MARATGVDFVVQKITTQLLFFLAEWWLDRTAGFPWYEEIFIKLPDIGEAENRIRSLILNTNGVASLESFDATFDGATRHSRITFRATTDAGEDTGEVIIDA